MRTRFLNIDYFSVGPPPPAPSSPAQTLAFLDLPVPRLPLAPPLASEQDLLCFGSLAAIEASLELGRLEIRPALSRFLTDVVPRFVDAGRGEGCGNGSIEKEGELSPAVKERLDCCSTIKTAATEDELPKISSESFINEKGAQGIAVFQLETPELTNCLENAYLLEEEAVGIFSEVLEIENNETFEIEEYIMQKLHRVEVAIKNRIVSYLDSAWTSSLTDTIWDSSSNG